MRTYNECGFGEKQEGDRWTRYDINNFSFFTGEVHEDAMKESLGTICIPLNEEWRSFFQKHTDRFDEFRRYTMEEDHFCERTLEKLKEHYPFAGVYQKIDETIFHQLSEEDWSESLVAAYSDYEEFHLWGNGFVKIAEGEIIGGISAYVPYRDGYEIEIDVHPDYQGAGVGKALASYFILDCIENETTPYWDAHTKISRNLALKLGYKVKNEYTAYSPLDQ